MPFPNPATQFRPGVSGNPAGRPRDRLSPLLRQAMGRVEDDGESIAARVAAVLVREALAGNYRAMAIILDRVDGRLPRAPRSR
jgi:Family of unknown function (DUF5681)